MHYVLAEYIMYSPHPSSCFSVEDAEDEFGIDDVGPPFRESTVLTVSVPGSVAETHRRTESGIESLTSLKIKHNKV